MVARRAQACRPVGVHAVAGAGGVSTVVRQLTCCPMQHDTSLTLSPPPSWQPSDFTGEAEGSKKELSYLSDPEMETRILFFTSHLFDLSVVLGIIPSGNAVFPWLL